MNVFIPLGSFKADDELSFDIFRRFEFSKKKKKMFFQRVNLLCVSLRQRGYSSSSSSSSETKVIKEKKQILKTQQENEQGKEEKQGEREEKQQEKPPGFWEFIRERKLLFASIPFLMMLHRGFQEMGWPTVKATVTDVDETSLSYQYYIFDNRTIVKHTQRAKLPQRLLRQIYYGKEQTDFFNTLKRGDVIDVHINPKFPRCTVYQPLPLAVWHFGLTEKHHPQLGRLIDEDPTPPPIDRVESNE